MPTSLDADSEGRRGDLGRACAILRARGCTLVTIGDIVEVRLAADNRTVIPGSERYDLHAALRGPPYLRRWHGTPRDILEAVRQEFGDD